MSCLDSRWGAVSASDVAKLRRKQFPLKGVRFRRGKVQISITVTVHTASSLKSDFFAPLSKRARQFFPIFNLCPDLQIRSFWIRCMEMNKIFSHTTTQKHYSYTKKEVVGPGSERERRIWLPPLLINVKCPSVVLAGWLQALAFQCKFRSGCAKPLQTWTISGH